MPKKVSSLSDIINIALSRTSRGIPAAISKVVTSQYNIKASDVKKVVSVRLSHIEHEIRIAVDNKPIPLKYFGARQLVFGGVSIAIKKGNRTTIPRAFVGGWVPYPVMRRRGRVYKMKYIGERLGGHVFIPVDRPFGKIKKAATGAVRIGFIVTSYKNFPALQEDIVTTFNKRFSEAFSYFRIV